jgi:hypothetical protein
MLSFGGLVVDGVCVVIGILFHPIPTISYLNLSGLDILCRTIHPIPTISYLNLSGLDMLFILLLVILFLLILFPT